MSQDVLEKAEITTSFSQLFPGKPKQGKFV